MSTNNFKFVGSCRRSGKILGNDINRLAPDTTGEHSHVLTCAFVYVSKGRVYGN